MPLNSEIHSEILSFFPKNGIGIGIFLQKFSERNRNRNGQKTSESEFFGIGIGIPRSPAWNVEISARSVGAHNWRKILPFIGTLPIHLEQSLKMIHSLVGIL